MMSLTTKDIKIGFSNKPVLRGINAFFQQGTLNSIIGVNGAGKTLYVKSIANLVPHSGTTLLRQDNTLLGYDTMSYVPQMNAVSSELTVFEMILLGKVRQLMWRVKQEVLDEVDQVINRLHLTEVDGQRFSTLSGGQKQLVMMAQSIVSKPMVLLLDEPTSALDLKHQIEVLDIAKKYAVENEAITLVVMHDLSLVSRYSDTVMVLDHGTVLKHGTPHEIMEKELLENVYGIEVEVTTTPQGYKTVTPIRIPSKGPSLNYDTGMTAVHTG
ncbi:MAG: ABC transporter ATP-binding protein [Treponema sp.]|jgi:iron complex transport system ATP-binding protein|nr:ABC transporter ATP-binding protein [Treponema sp.]